MAGGLAVSPAQAATSAVEGEAWGENLGWINFGTPEGNVDVGDTKVTGYAWSSSSGWINLGPFLNASGVTNTTAGILGGYAWSDQLGWLNMTGVTIASSGQFTGIANVGGTRAGRVTFNCTRCHVTTVWRPTAASASTPSGTATVGSAPSAPAQAAQPAPPAPGPSTPSPVAAPAASAGTAAPGTLFDINVQAILPSHWPWWLVWLLSLVILALGIWWLIWRARRRHRRQHPLGYPTQTRGSQP